MEQSTLRQHSTRCTPLLLTPPVFLSPWDTPLKHLTSACVAVEAGAPVSAKYDRCVHCVVRVHVTPAYDGLWVCVCQRALQMACNTLMVQAYPECKAYLDHIFAIMPKVLCFAPAVWWCHVVTDPSPTTDLRRRTHHSPACSQLQGVAAISLGRQRWCNSRREASSRFVGVSGCAVACHTPL